jgi:membrane protein
VLHLVDFAASLVGVTLLFALLFKVVPDVEVGWRDVWIGAAASALLFAVGKLALGFFLGRGSFVSAYGAAGSLVAVLLWVYYTAQILFFGAELTQVQTARRRRVRASAGARPADRVPGGAPTRQQLPSRS